MRLAFEDVRLAEEPMGQIISFSVPRSKTQELLDKPNRSAWIRKVVLEALEKEKSTALAKENPQ
jgi:hypothetical protein